MARYRILYARVYAQFFRRYLNKNRARSVETHQVANSAVDHTLSFANTGWQIKHAARAKWARFTGTNPLLVEASAHFYRRRNGCAPILVLAGVGLFSIKQPVKMDSYLGTGLVRPSFLDLISGRSAECKTCSWHGSL